jgi:isopropylmalate/homocitrate/citramalate synthase
VIGKHSGRAAFKHSLAEIGIDLSGTAFEKAFAKMKDVADETGEVSPERIRLIVEEVVSGVEVMDGVSASFG